MQGWQLSVDLSKDFVFAQLLFCLLQVNMFSPNGTFLFKFKIISNSLYGSDTGSTFFFVCAMLCQGAGILELSLCMCGGWWGRRFKATWVLEVGELLLWDCYPGSGAGCPVTAGFQGAC